jgi:acyl carrier protein
LKTEYFLDRNSVFKNVKELLISEFKLDPGLISLDKRINEDLELDSLDMVDMIIALSDQTGKKIDPSLFKDACTVQDLVDSVYNL